ncbi:MAG: hypothetical protein ACRC0Y_07635 [Fusobacteriaceae bacterium]
MIFIKLKDICEIKNGILVKKELRNQFGHKIIYPKDLDNLYDIDTNSLDNYGEIKTFYKNNLQYNDILIETKEPFRITILKEIFLPKCGIVATSNFIVLRRKLILENAQKYPPNLICTFLKTDKIKEIFKKYTQNKLVLNQDEIGDLEIPDFSKDDIDIVNSSLETLYKRKRIMLSLKKRIEYELSEDNKRFKNKIKRFFR